MYKQIASSLAILPDAVRFSSIAFRGWQIITSSTTTRSYVCCCRFICTSTRLELVHGWRLSRRSLPAGRIWEQVDRLCNGFFQIKFRTIGDGEIHASTR